MRGRNKKVFKNDVAIRSLCCAVRVYDKHLCNILTASLSVCCAVCLCEDGWLEGREGE